MAVNPRVKLLKPHGVKCRFRGAQTFAWIFSTPIEVEYRSKSGIKRSNSHDRWARFRCNDIDCKGHGVVRLRDIEMQIADALS